MNHYCKDNNPSYAIYGIAVYYCTEHDDGTLWIGNDEYENQINFCPFCGYKAKSSKAELKKEVKREVRLYVIDEGNPNTMIPVLTNDPENIRWNVGNEDHGGREWKDFLRVLSNGEIKAINNKESLPTNLLGAYPYCGQLSCLICTCGEFCDLMDENGVIKEETKCN